MKYTKNHNFHDPSQQFKGILYYSQSHIAMYNKIFITLSDKFVSNIQEYWKVLCPRVNEFRPKSEKNKCANKSSNAMVNRNSRCSCFLQTRN